MVEGKKDSINYKLVMQKFIEQKAGHAGKAAELLAITEAEVMTILDGGEVGVKARQSLMKIAAHLRWDSPVRSTPSRELSDEKLARISGENDEDTGDDLTQQTDTSTPKIVTKGRQPIQPRRVSEPFARQAPKAPPDESEKAGGNVEDVFDEIAAITSGKKDAVVGHREPDMTSVSGSEMRDTEKEYEQHVDSFAEQVREEIEAEYPAVSEEVAVQDEDANLKEQPASEVAGLATEKASEVEQTEVEPEPVQEEPTVVVGETEAAEESVEGRVEGAMGEAPAQQDVQNEDAKAMIKHLAGLEKKEVVKSQRGEIVRDGKQPEAARIGAGPETEDAAHSAVLAHYDRILASIDNEEDIRAHIREGMSRRVSWLLYEVCKKEREFIEHESEPRQRERAQKMLDKREDQDPTIISQDTIEGETDFYTPEAYEAILQWRNLKVQIDDYHSLPENEQASSDYFRCCDEVLAIEVYLIQEHGLTIPEESPINRKVAAWDSLERKEQIVWRLEDRKRVAEEFHSAVKNESREASLEMFKNIGRLPGKVLKIGRK